LRRDLSLPREQSRALLEVIVSQAGRLSQITEQILLAGRLDRGSIALERTRVDVAELARAAVAAMRPRLPADTSLRLVIAGEVGTALGDRDKIEQVLVNLIDNAIKYSPGGGVVTVTATRSEAAVRIAVADEGLGIARGDQGRIFEKFYRADPQLTRAPGGSGLGLYISRELVARMGGRIEVVSAPGAGSTFTVELAADDA